MASDTGARAASCCSWAHSHDVQDPKIWKTFAKRYRAEMGKTDPRQTIRTLAEVAKRTPISVGCYCDTPHCHRFELES